MMVKVGVSTATTLDRTINAVSRTTRIRRSIDPAAIVTTGGDRRHDAWDRHHQAGSSFRNPEIAGNGGQ
jgi:hypothetical protein